MKIRLTCCTMVLFGVMTFNAQAASIWLDPATNVDINSGEVATYQLWADAADVGGFLAGGLDLFYDSNVLTYNDDFAFDPSFPTDPDFSRPGTSGDPDNCFLDPSVTGCSGPGEINGIAFGNFNGLAADGPILVGTLSFTGLSLGVSPMTMADNDTPAGNWFATDGTDLAGLVEYVVEPGELTDVNVVPVPAAVWLFGTGLLGLVGVARRRK